MTSHPNAKVNIGLDVLRRRPDGYHDLESLFVPYFQLVDTLEIEESSRFSIEIYKDGELMTASTPGGWNPLEDLTVKAYMTLKKDFQLPPVRIRLEKGIPVGAGLGGGSSDAAFALKMLDGMFDLFLPDIMLEIYAAQLGSDCPFFIYDRPMFVSGRGEVLEDFECPFLEDFELRVKIPQGIMVSTKEAYSGIIPSVPEMTLREALMLPVEKWRGIVKNDFERTVFAAHPQLSSVKDDFYAEGAVFASMSGSGSAVYGMFPKNR